MSVRVESPPIRRSFDGSIVVAIIVALGIGIFAGTVITKAVDDRPAAVGTPLLNAQELASMEENPLAARFRIAQPVTWDAQKLDAMAGRVQYLPVAVEAEVAMTAKPSITQPQAPALWDTYKLEAMAGRVLAAGVGAEDPPVKPHIPKRPPR